MVRLEKSKVLGRMIRKDDLNELVVPTWKKIKAAIEAGRTQEALDLADYLPVEGSRLNDMTCDNIWGYMTWIANNIGEEEVYRALREVSMAEQHYKMLQQLTPEEFVQLRAESIRVHRVSSEGMGDDAITEEEDRYVISMNPCGSGGRMRRKGRMEPPFNYGKTKKAYPWSWGRVGIPYYCLHCCVWSEIMPIEWFGYPQRVTSFSDNPNDPCIWYVYKKPELIPEEYFTRVGKKKDLSRIKKSLLR